MILKFHIQHYLNKSKKWHTWHSLAANFTYGTLKSGLDLQCYMIALWEMGKLVRIAGEFCKHIKCHFCL